VESATVLVDVVTGQIVTVLYLLYNVNHVTSVTILLRFARTIVANANAGAVRTGWVSVPVDCAREVVTWVGRSSL